MKNRLIKLYRDWNIKHKLIVIISLLIVISVTLVSILSYSRYSYYFTEQTKEQTQEIIEQININVDTYMNELLRLSLTPYFSNSIMSELENKPTNDIEKLEKQRKIEGFLGSVMILPREDILRVYIMTGEDVYSNIKTPYDMENYIDYSKCSWYKQAQFTQNQIFIPVHSEKVFGNKKAQIFSVVQSIRSKKDNSKVLGVIKVDANYEGIKSICDKVKLKEDSALFIIDKDKNVIYQNSKFPNGKLKKSIYEKSLNVNGSNFSTIDGTKYVINTSPLKTTDWKVVEITSYSQLNKYFLQTRNTAILFALVFAAAAVFILILFINSFLNPIFDIVKSMRKVQKGDLDVQVPVKNHDEIGYLTESFNSMVSDIKEMMTKNTNLVKEVYQSRYLQKEAQYNVLCSQIKPHFLYNTLNTISLLIKCDEQDQAVDDIQKLSYFLRGAMNTDKEIPLTSELKIVDSYLSLQKSRYKDRITYNVEVPKQFMNYYIPALTLQPVVENAIIHGCELKRGNSTIKLYCTTKDKYLMIHIEDNGKGIEENKLKELNLSLANTTKGQDIKYKNIFSESIGLLNVNSRLRLKFGMEYGISITSKIGSGTCVTLKLPL